MLKYTTKEIIERAEQLADLQNSDFISDKEKQSLLNEAWVGLYQKLINTGDKTFIKKFTCSGDVVLPDDFFELSGVYLKDKVSQVFRMNNASLSGYDIVNNALTFSKNLQGAEITVEYYPTPKTLFYKGTEKKELPIDMTGTDEPLIAGDNYYISNNYNLYYEDEDPVEIEIEGVTKLLALKNCIIGIEEGSFGFYSFQGQLIKLVVTGEDVGVIVGNELTYDKLLSDDIPADAIAYVTDSSHDQGYWLCTPPAPTFLMVRNKNKDVVESVTPTYAIYCRQDGLYLVSSNNMRRLLGKVVEHFNDPVNSFKAIINDNYLIAKNNFTEKYYSVPYGFDTLLEYPSNLYFVLLAYSLAISFKLKQNGDVSALSVKLQEAESQFNDSLNRDINDEYQIRNVYQQRGWLGCL